MIYFLTGDIQIGKTRWLSRLVEELESDGVLCEGVLAPGIWRQDSLDNYEKLGINNELLPDHEVITFALRDDIAKEKNLFDDNAESAHAGMKWHISDRAIELVNNHFLKLHQHKFNLLNTSSTTINGNCLKNSDAQKRVLIIDELGQLELKRNGGLTEALKLLEEGPSDYYSAAIVIVRNAFGLLELAEDRFAEQWDGSMRISPQDGI